MHLTFDLMVNGEYVLKRAFLFYLFSYRARRGFAARELGDPKSLLPAAGERPLLEFFQWRPSIECESREPEASKIANSPENAV